MIDHEDTIDSSEEYNEEETNEDYLSLNTTNTKLKVGTSLKAYTLYEFRVIAVNLLGKSKATRPILVRTAPTSKDSFLNQSIKNKKIFMLFFFNLKEPGHVRDIRFTHENDSLFIIKCDLPEDPNGNLTVLKS